MTNREKFINGEIFKIPNVDLLFFKYFLGHLMEFGNGHKIVDLGESSFTFLVKTLKEEEYYTIKFNDLEFYQLTKA